jgi:hypothetical protein
MMLSPVEDALAGILKVCLPDTYINVNKLFEYCKVPSKCGQTLECEGTTALVTGFIDYNNVFEHARYPQLPYEKFFLAETDGKTIEVVAVSLDNRHIFRKISDARKCGLQQAFVKGIIRGIDAPVMGTCRRWIRLEVRDAEDIYFK